MHQLEVLSSTKDIVPAAFERYSSFAPGDVEGVVAVAAKQPRRSP